MTRLRTYQNDQVLGNQEISSLNHQVIWLFDKYITHRTWDISHLTSVELSNLRPFVDTLAVLCYVLLLLAEHLDWGYLTQKRDEMESTRRVFAALLICLFACTTAFS